MLIGKRPMPSIERLLLSRLHKQEAISLKKRLCSELICKISTYFGSGTPLSQKQLLTSLLLSALPERAEWCLWLRRKWTHNIIPELGLRPGSEVGMILCQLKGVLETKKELEQLCKRICHRITLCACLSQCIPAAKPHYYAFQSSYHNCQTFRVHLSKPFM